MFNTLSSNDLRIIFICIAVATFFWFFNELNKEHKAQISYPIEFQYDSQFVALEPLPNKVEINVTGKGWEIIAQHFKKKPIIYKISRPLAIPYILPAKLRPLLLKEIRDVKIDQIVNDTFFVKFDKIIEKKIKIAIDTAKLHLEDNYKLTSAIKLTPDVITLKGPKSKLKEIAVPFLLSIPEKNIDHNYEEELKIPHPTQPFTEIIEKKVMVKFDVEEYKNETHEIKLTKLNPPKNIQLTEDVIKISYSFKKADAELIKPEDFELMVDFNNLNPKDSTIVIQLIQFPKQAKNITFSPSQIKVIYEK